MRLLGFSSHDSSARLALSNTGSFIERNQHLVELQSSASANCQGFDSLAGVAKSFAELCI